MPTTAAERWFHRRTHHHSEFPAARIAAEREATISVCLPAREVADTIGPILEALLELREAGAIDEVLVVDAASRDGTGALAARLGAEVHQEADLLPALGPVLGKGDAMWRALSVLRGELVCFLDADTSAFGAHFACGLLGPLVADSEVQFVKAYYRRPFSAGGVALPDGGGRVNELSARPLLGAFYPDLGGFLQPLAGEIAARRELLERIPFATGYAVETAMLIDVYRAAGLDAMAQVDLDERRNRHQELSALAPMAAAVVSAVATRLEREGRLAGPASGTLLVRGPDGALGAREAAPVERPPLAQVRAAQASN